MLIRKCSSSFLRFLHLQGQSVSRRYVLFEQVEMKKTKKLIISFYHFFKRTLIAFFSRSAWHFIIECASFYSRYDTLSIFVLINCAFQCHRVNYFIISYILFDNWRWWWWWSYTHLLILRHQKHKCVPPHWRHRKGKGGVTGWNPSRVFFYQQGYFRLIRMALDLLVTVSSDVTWS